MKTSPNFIFCLFIIVMLAIQGGLSNSTITFMENENTKVESSLKKARSTIEEQGQTIDLIMKEYSELLTGLSTSLVPYCEGIERTLPEALFGLEPFNRKKTVSINMLQKIGFEQLKRFAAAFPTEAQTNILIDIQDDKISFQSSAEEQVRNQQFVVFLAQEIGQPICQLKLAMHFSDPAKLAPGWRASHIFGRAGLAHGEFSLPYGTEFVEQMFWSSDCTNNNISVLDLQGNLKGVVKGTADEPLFNTPADIKIRDKKLYVVSENSNLLQVFDLESPNAVNESAVITTNSFEGDQGLIEMIYPLGIAIGGGHVAITDGKSRIIGLDKNLKVRWVSDNSGSHNPFTWNNPYYIEYHPLLNVFVVSNQTEGEMAIVDISGKKLGLLVKELLPRL